MSTLEEKFLPLTLLDASDEERGNQCVNIAEEFAIEFADWMKQDRLNGYKHDTFTTKELLEIYKQENKL